MAHQVLWQKLSFQPIDPANPTVPTGDPETVLRGGLVPDYVPSFTINALLNAGMIMAIADRPDPAIKPSSADPAPAVGPDTPPVLPDGTSTLVIGEPPASNPEKPKPSDSREKWETYGAAVGMNLGELEAMPNKAAVVDAVNAHEADPV